MPAERTDRSRINNASCQMCRAKKLKCDLGQPCSNCSSRRWTCEYAGRQDPVACQMCRSKKIKCSRTLPCSNCSLRQWKCEYEHSPSAWPNTSLRQSPAVEGSETESSVQARLANLEKAVFGRMKEEQHANTPTEKVETNQTTPLSDTDGQQDVASGRWLEDVCSGLAGTSPQLIGDLSLDVQTIDQLAFDHKHSKKPRHISLPPRDFAFRVLDLYEVGLQSAQQYTHVTTMRVKVRQLYDRGTRRDATSESGTAILLLALCAQIGFWDMYEWHGLFPNADVAAKVSTIFVQQAMDMLDYCRESAIITVETVQAALMLIFLLYHMEGYSAWIRILHSLVLVMARELNLHRIDATPRDPSSLTADMIVGLETGRKLWWYIASMDWILAFNSGPTEGVYSVIPQQMRVKKPRNLRSEDLLNQGPDFERPSNEATTMAYYFFRIKLAETCREAVDCMLINDPDTAPYEKVYGLDAKFVALITGLPRILRLDVAAETIRSELGDADSNQFALQRALANLMVSVRRCKLHLPFLIRCKANPRYTFSRNACLESARHLLQAHRVFQDDQTGHLTSFLKLLNLHNFTFYATMVLVMDLCVNKTHHGGSGNDDSHLARAQILEVRDALKIVTDAESTNRTASKFLAALRDVLAKHGISLPIESNSTLTMLKPHSRPESGTHVSNHQGGVSQQIPTTDNRSRDTDFVFSNSDFIWQGDWADNESFLDPHCWDELLNLDMRVI